MFTADNFPTANIIDDAVALLKKIMTSRRQTARVNSHNAKMTLFHLYAY